MTRPEESIGEAIVSLLEAYGVDTVFGIPGVHNVEMYRALPRSGIRHILPRHEQGAGFMADGYARATGRPGVCFTITGPGLTNVLTPVGQAYSDSVPMLVLSSTLDLADAARGRGRLHEMRDQRCAAQTVCGTAVTANTAQDVQDAISAAFARFANERPRPHYIEVPIDVLNRPAGSGWQRRQVAERPGPRQEDVGRAVAMLREAKRPVLVIGGGARFATDAVRSIAENTGAIVLTTVAAKGLLPDNFDLLAGAALPDPAASKLVMEGDVVLAAGTEMSETDLWYQTFDVRGDLIRVDIDPAVLAGPYPAALPILADAPATLEAIAVKLRGTYAAAKMAAASTGVAELRDTLKANEDELRRALRVPLAAIRAALPDDAIVVSDMTQIAYAGNEIFPTSVPATWLHPAGFGTLGYALPAAIGAKAGVGERAVAALAGDYGLQYTINELATAAEMEISLPILLWNNDLLGAIHDDMVKKGIQPNAVTQKNPDFIALAKAYHCDGCRPGSPRELEEALRQALAVPRPTIIEMTPALASA